MHANDGTNDTVKDVSVSVTDTNDVAPAITSTASAGVAENTSPGSVVYTVTATDSDTIGSLSYSLSGTDAAQFSIDAATGEVRFLSSPDFEAPTDFDGDNTYQITVHANDGANDTAKDVSLSVTDTNDVAPAIISAASADVAENTSPGSVVYTAVASDPDTVGSVSYSLSGVDAARFRVEAATGEVRFLSSPDFEVPTDFDGDNTYQIAVHANEGTNDTVKDVSVSVTDTNDVAPTITSPASAGVAESTSPGSVVYTAVASDPDTVGALSFSLSGLDAAAFSVDAATGEVRFLAAPDFEAPADADANNVYQITVHAFGRECTIPLKTSASRFLPDPDLSVGKVSYFDAIGGVYVDLPTQVAKRGGPGASWLGGSRERAPPLSRSTRWLACMTPSARASTICWLRARRAPSCPGLPAATRWRVAPATTGLMAVRVPTS